MKNIIILSVVLLILAISTFLIACDDFFSPTIEIFNKIENPTKVNIEQEHKQEQKKEQKQENINQQQEFLGYIVN